MKSAVARVWDMGGADRGTNQSSDRVAGKSTFRATAQDTQTKGAFSLWNLGLWNLGLRDIRKSHILGLLIIAGQAFAPGPFALAQSEVTIVVPQSEKSSQSTTSDDHAEASTIIPTSPISRDRPMVLARTITDLAGDALVYKQHIFTLTNPYMEGRAPGTEGNRHAADYVEWYYRKAGLQPAFTPDVAGEGAAMEPDGKSFRQRFIAPPSQRPGDSVKLNAQGTKVLAGAVEQVLVAGTDFATLGFSSTGNANGNVIFTGYAIEEGEDDYSSIPRDAEGKKIRLDGNIAMVLRFEPMDDEGKSKWSSSRWSPAADLTSKIDALIDLGASAVVLVNPPGADDKRATELGDLSMGLSGRARKVPVIMLANAAADAFVRKADGSGRSLLELRQLADDVKTPQQYVELSNAMLDINVDIERVPLWTDNVGAVLPGSGSLRDQYIVIGSHYDHIGYGYFGSRSGEKGRGVLHPGADDNASGTSGNILLAGRLAEAYKAMEKDAPGEPRRSILFIAFCAEESGLNGSVHYVNNPIVPLEQHTLMINMDMIGRLRDGKLELSGVGTGDGLADFIKSYTDSSGMTVASKPSGLGPSDHASFAQSNVPVIFAFTGLHEEYHRITDTPDTINYDGAVEVADLLYRIALDISTYEPGFPFTTATGSKPGESSKNNNDQGQGQSTRGVGVRFGVAPGDYSGNEEGVLIGEVLKDLPAEKAGLKAGDLMIRWNEKPLIDVEGWMGMLSQHKPGDKVAIVYIRDGKESSTEATLVSRNNARQ